MVLGALTAGSPTVGGRSRCRDPQPPRSQHRRRPPGGVKGGVGNLEPRVEPGGPRAEKGTGADVATSHLSGAPGAQPLRPLTTHLHPHTLQFPALVGGP